MEIGIVNLLSLSNEILEVILLITPPHELGNLSFTCSKLHSIIHHNGFRREYWEYHGLAIIRKYRAVPEMGLWKAAKSRNRRAIEYFLDQLNNDQHVNAATAWAMNDDIYGQGLLGAIDSNSLNRSRPGIDDHGDILNLLLTLYFRRNCIASYLNDLGDPARRTVLETPSSQLHSSSQLHPSLHMADSPNYISAYPLSGTQYNHLSMIIYAIGEHARWDLLRKIHLLLIRYPPRDPDGPEDIVLPGQELPHEHTYRKLGIDVNFCYGLFRGLHYRDFFRLYSELDETEKRRLETKSTFKLLFTACCRKFNLNNDPNCRWNYQKLIEFYLNNRRIPVDVASTMVKPLISTGVTHLDLAHFKDLISFLLQSDIPKRILIAVLDSTISISKLNSLAPDDAVDYYCKHLSGKIITQSRHISLLKYFLPQRPEFISIMLLSSLKLSWETFDELRRFLWTLLQKHLIEDNSDGTDYLIHSRLYKYIVCMLNKVKELNPEIREFIGDDIDKIVHILLLRRNIHNAMNEMIAAGNLASLKYVITHWDTLKYMYNLTQSIDRHYTTGFHGNVGNHPDTDLGNHPGSALSIGDGGEFDIIINCGSFINPFGDADLGNTPDSALSIGDGGEFDIIINHGNFINPAPFGDVTVQYRTMIVNYIRDAIEYRWDEIVKYLFSYVLEKERAKYHLRLDSNPTLAHAIPAVRCIRPGDWIELKSLAGSHYMLSVVASIEAEFSVIYP